MAKKKIHFKDSNENTIHKELEELVSFEFLRLKSLMDDPDAGSLHFDYCTANFISKVKTYEDLVLVRQEINGVIHYLYLEYTNENLNDAVGWASGRQSNNMVQHREIYPCRFIEYTNSPRVDCFFYLNNSMVDPEDALLNFKKHIAKKQLKEKLRYL